MRYITTICENCDPRRHKPGKVIEVNSQDDPFCPYCGRDLSDLVETRMSYENKRWDTYFHNLCISVASKSPCLSRKIGAILVRDHSVVSTGYNGPPRGIPHCGHERWMKDKALHEIGFMKMHEDELRRFHDECPRHVLGYESGTHMELCPAQHAEENAVSNAARLGVSVLGSTLYMNSVIPCQKCFGTLINAGIKEIVIEKAEVYDKHTQFLIDNSKILIREFEL